MIALWGLQGKSCLLGFPLVLFLFYAVLIVRVPFLFGVLDRMWNSIVSVPDHCISSIWPRSLGSGILNKGTIEQARWSKYSLQNQN